jgi:tetratricopeptide (TPR) repeat protein
LKRLIARSCIAGLLTIAVACCSWGQQSGSSGSTGPGSSGSSGTSTAPTQPGNSSPGNQSQPQVRQQIPEILNVSGRIVMETGQPVPEPVAVALTCGVRSLQVIQTDFKGYFQFTLGSGIQSNIDFSASNDAPGGPGDQSVLSSNGVPGGFGTSERKLTGCELKVAVPGFQPLSRIITEQPDITGIEVGTLRLVRIAGVEGASISVTSLLVPNNARKEFEKGDKDARTNHLDSATQHLEKAVAQYDKYAAAWNELGNLYASGKDLEKSANAYKKSIDADSRYIPPYLGLASLELRNKEFEACVETSGKALELDPTGAAANFIYSFANLQLGRLDEAQKAAQVAEKGPHQNFPNLHPLLANIFLQKQDYTNAAVQMRAYLKEFPQGQFANDMKADLAQIENSQSSQEIAPPLVQK